jgi:hypothetical protein
MRLFSVSPATPFSDVSLPNHTKMFELVHMVTSMDDFVCNGIVPIVIKHFRKGGTMRIFFFIDVF